MLEEISDVYQAAEVILLIIHYEGEIEDIIEYPPEFEEAYIELLERKIIKKGEGKYMPGENFSKAYPLGYKKYLEKIAKQIKAREPSKFRKYVSNKPALGILAGAIFLTAGYLMKPEKKSMKSSKVLNPETGSTHI